MGTSVGLHISKRFQTKYLVPTELCVDWKGFCWLIYWSSCTLLLFFRPQKLQKKSNLSNSKYNAHTEQDLLPGGPYTCGLLTLVRVSWYFVIFVLITFYWFFFMSSVVCFYYVLCQINTFEVKVEKSSNWIISIHIWTLWTDWQCNSSITPFSNT